MKQSSSSTASQNSKFTKKDKSNEKEGILKYSSYQPDKNYIFHSLFGHPLRSTVARYYFKQVCERTAVPILSPHALRYSHAVYLLEATAAIKTASTRIAPASARMAADVYVHVTKKREAISLSKYQDDL